MTASVCERFYGWFRCNNNYLSLLQSIKISVAAWYTRIALFLGHIPRHLHRLIPRHLHRLIPRHARITSSPGTRASPHFQARVHRLIPRHACIASFPGTHASPHSQALASSHSQARMHRLIPRYDSVSEPLQMTQPMRAKTSQLLCL